MKFKAVFVLLAIIQIVASTSCKKQDEWLNVKKNKSDVMPKTIEDYSGLLENAEIMNNTPSLGLVSSDNYVIKTFTAWQSLYSTTERNAYLWNSEIYESDPGFSWITGYQTIAYSNIVLDGVKQLQNSGDNKVLYDNIVGSALFYRAFALYQMVQLFAKPYDPATAGTDISIPIRTNSDINVKSTNSTVKQTYDQIINDLEDALNLLPDNQEFKNKPTKYAVNAMLCKVYLHMGVFEKVKDYASKVINSNAELINFNDLTLIPFGFPFPAFRSNNNEIIFYAYFDSSEIGGMLWYDPATTVDDDLYKSYLENDLRKSIFFTNSFGGLNFQGFYTGKPSIFSGIALNEIYLIRAEANARLKQKDLAMADLNKLLEKRWKTDTYVQMTANSADEALELILKERRKELPFTGNLRWEDLRRLNRDPKFAITLTRILNGTTYTLPPNDNRYVMPIPENEIHYSGIAQNPR